MRACRLSFGECPIPLMDRCLLFQVRALGGGGRLVHPDGSLLIVPGEGLGGGGGGRLVHPDGSLLIVPGEGLGGGGGGEVGTS